jgi:geranylgeranyl diphosphate synthase type II
MLYALGMNLFLSVDEAAERRLRALEHLTRTAVITACGELREMLVGAAAGDVPTAAEVTEISEWKTAHYSFACPLVTGAVLAGVDDDEAESLYRYAVAAGVAFQIRDDIHDIAGVSRDGSRYDDLREGTLTLPLWYALRVVPERDRVRMLQGIGSGASARVEDLAAARDIIVACGGVEYATRIAGEYAQSSREMLHDLRMAPSCRAVLADYVDGLLSGPRVGIRPAPAASGVAALEDVPRPRGTSLDGIRISVCNNMVGAPGQWAAHAGTGSDS